MIISSIQPVALITSQDASASSADANAASATQTSDSLTGSQSVTPLQDSTKDNASGVRVTLSDDGLRALHDSEANDTSSTSDTSRAGSAGGAGGAGGANAANSDIDDSDLPETIKELLKRIRELRAQLQQQMAEMQRIMADQSLSEEKRAKEISNQQSKVAALNAALTQASQQLTEAVAENNLNDTQVQKVASLAMS